MKKLSIIVVLVGLIFTIFSTITFFTNEKVVAIGKFEIAMKKVHHLDLSPITGIAIMGIGGILFWQTYNEQ